MNIRSITVKDFLPFEGRQTVEFATDPERNVTVIMGENGSGKTSLAEAFGWCFYGAKPKGLDDVINASVNERIDSGESVEVSVEVKLEKDGVLWTVIRKQQYTRSRRGGNVTHKPSKLTVGWRDERGGYQTVEDNARARNDAVNKLLPERLSRYFFFDGEHVRSMGEEIERGKSSDFAEAVKAILGLSPIDNAIKDLKSRKNSVWQLLWDTLKLEDDGVLRAKRAAISRDEERIAKQGEAIADLESEVAEAERSIEEYKELLLNTTESEKAQRAVSDAERQLHINESRVAESRDALFELFKSGNYRFFIERPVRDALQMVEDVKPDFKGIPGVNADTIKTILREHKCICGTTFEEGDPVDETLHELLKVVPPRSLGACIGEFKRQCGVRTESEDTLKKEMAEARLRYRQALAYVEHSTDELELARAHLDSIQAPNVQEIRDKLSAAEANRRRLTDGIAVRRNNIEDLTKGIAQLRAEVEEAAALDEKNAKTRLRLEYVEYIHDYLVRFYKEHEEGTRRDLADLVNEFFTTMYNGELYLVLDENYCVDVRAHGVEVIGDWSTSSGQTLAVILAFIMGVLELAKRNKDDGESLLEGDTYPLVMDAPLSDFDRKRIEAICGLLPGVAEQVVIIIKDTDGDLAVEQLSEHIGKKYRIDKLTDYQSEINRD